MTMRLSIDQQSTAFHTHRRAAVLAKQLHKTSGKVQNSRRDIFFLNSVSPIGYLCIISRLAVAIRPSRRVSIKAIK